MREFRFFFTFLSRSLTLLLFFTCFTLLFFISPLSFLFFYSFVLLSPNSFISLFFHPFILLSFNPGTFLTPTSIPSPKE